MLLCFWICLDCDWIIDCSWEFTVFIFSFFTFYTLLTRSLARNTFSLRSRSIVCSKLVLTIITLRLTLPFLLKEISNVTTTRSTTNPIVFFRGSSSQGVLICLTGTCSTRFITWTTLIVSHLFVHCEKIIVPLKLDQTFLSINSELFITLRCASVHLSRLQEVVLILERCLWNFAPTFEAVVGVIILAVTARVVTF